MKTIKIKYVDFWPDFDVSKDLIFKVLSSCGKYEVEFSETPDYLVYSAFGNDHLSYDCIRIFYTGEEQSPNFNICDYAISFEFIEFMDRHFRLPLMYQPLYGDDYEKMINRGLTNAVPKTEFCSFVYSNGQAHPLRGEFFDKLSEYKKVNSGGKYKNNVGGPVIDKCDFESKHKFSIAFENVSHTGYMTEKLMQAFAAGGIPIYWGDPLVEKTFNPKAFINIMNFQNIDEAIDYIKYVDQHDDVYEAIFRENALNNDMNREVVEQNFSVFIEHIFDQSIEEAKRATRRYWLEQNNRQETHIEPLCKLLTPVRRVRNKLIKMLKKNRELLCTK